MMKKLNLSKRDCERVTEKFNSYIQNPQLMLDEVGPDVLDQVKSGVDEFYKTFENPLSEDDIRQKLSQTIAQMTLAEQYTYLGNLMVAMTASANGMLFGEDWDETVKRYETMNEKVSSDQAMTDEELRREIGQMLDMIPKETDAVALLFMTTPLHEEFEKLCQDADAKEVKALVMNSRDNAIAYSMAIYELVAEGELDQYKDYRPKQLGLVVTAALEMDAAMKTQSWNVAKDVVSKILRTVFQLFLTSPGLLLGGAAMMFLTLSGLSNLVLLVIGSVIVYNISVYAKMIRKSLSGLNEGVDHFVDKTLDAVRQTYDSVKTWAQSTIMPSVHTFVKKTTDFVIDHLFVPVVSVFKTFMSHVEALKNRVFERVDASVHREPRENDADSTADVDSDDEEEELRRILDEFEQEMAARKKREVSSEESVPDEEEPCDEEELYDEEEASSDEIDADGEQNDLSV